MAPNRPSNYEDDQVLVEGNSHIKTMILNRPLKFNALNYQMVLQLSEELQKLENDPVVGLVIVKANGKVFCAGGDVIEYYRCSLTGEWALAAKIYQKQLTLDYLVATYIKPVVFLINGAVMGGGAGLSMNTSYRVVTENTVFAMPEAAIGHYPDVGASYFLSKLPGFLGEYLGLTGAKLNGAEMVACGLATHFVPSKNLLLLEKSLHEVDVAEPNTIQGIISKYTQQVPLKEHSVLHRLNLIDHFFSKQTVEQILSSLEHENATLKEEWITKSIRSMKAASPINLKIFFMSIRKGRFEPLEECLIRDSRISSHSIRRTMSNDFLVGVRATLLEKNYKPKWEPSKLELVSNDMVETYLTKIPEIEGWKELQLPTRDMLEKALRAKL
ncbi:probable 3-hydroxyisobutyryl-CoA hydrolase 3 isoform X1 [Zingiber officinale]|uniref:probable 3-hydroxyisobutyryl-CoA hydrolase 3 isoform X1 n=2 Tax=Zingiber officinale TaxID=94328 RepID=UPI001C4D6944|nr:probable 3-hydroxyisobutyryl-CoA hydrolase 3 isoform X1 [Zingiber officinale]